MLGVECEDKAIVKVERKGTLVGKLRIGSLLFTRILESGPSYILLGMHHRRVRLGTHPLPHEEEAPRRHA